jgi:hypothetical protein
MRYAMRPAISRTRRNLYERYLDAYVMQRGVSYPVNVTPNMIQNILSDQDVGRWVLEALSPQVRPDDIRVTTNGIRERVRSMLLARRALTPAVLEILRRLNLRRLTSNTRTSGD